MINFYDIVMAKQDLILRQVDDVVTDGVVVNEVDFSGYRSGLIDQAVESIKSREARALKVEQTMQALLTVNKAKKVNKVDGLKVKIELLRKRLNDESQSRQTELAKVVEKKKAEIAFQLQKDIEDLQKSLQSLDEAEKGKKIDSEIMSYEERLIDVFNHKGDQIKSAIDLEFREKPVDSLKICQKIWLEFLYPQIAGDFERQNGNVYTDGVMPKVGNRASYHRFMDRYYDSLIDPILTLYSETQVFSVSTELKSSWTAIIRSATNDCFRVTDHLEMNQSAINAGYISEGPNLRGIDIRLSRVVRFALIMAILHHMGLSTREFIESEFLETLDKMMREESQLKTQTYQQRASINSFGRELVLQALLEVSGYKDFLPGLNNRQVKKGDGEVDKIFVEIQKALLSSPKHKLQNAIAGKKKALAELDQHPEVQKIVDQGKKVSTTKEIEALEGEIEGVTASAENYFIDEDDRKNYSVLRDEQADLDGQLGDSDRSFAIKVDLQKYPRFAKEWQIAILRRQYAQLIRKALFDDQTAVYKDSIEGRAEQRLFDTEEKFLNGLPERFGEFIRDSLVAFDTLPTLPNWFSRIKSWVGLNATTKQSLYDQLQVDPDVEGFMTLNEWLYKLHTMGGILLTSADPKSKEMGKIHLEIAANLKKRYANLPENIEAKLAVPEIDLSELGVALSVLPTLLKKSGQAQLLNAIEGAHQIATEIAEVAPADPLADFDRRLVAGEKR